jgi:hypothetical protein
VCRHILAIVHNLDESMVDVRWRSALGFILEIQCMLESQVLSCKLWSLL